VPSARPGDGTVTLAAARASPRTPLDPTGLRPEISSGVGSEAVVGVLEAVDGRRRRVGGCEDEVGWLLPKLADGRAPGKGQAECGHDDEEGAAARLAARVDDGPWVSIESGNDPAACRYSTCEVSVPVASTVISNMAIGILPATIAFTRARRCSGWSSRR
jgi:hypothetical protein